MSEVITRPNGKPYRPRKGIRQIGFHDEVWPWINYVAVLGTHDVDKARSFARPYESPYLVEPRRAWVKRTMRNGEPYVATDAAQVGAAAVIFRESDDPEGSP